MTLVYGLARRVVGQVQWEADEEKWVGRKKRGKVVCLLKAKEPTLHMIECFPRNHVSR